MKAAIIIGAVLATVTAAQAQYGTKGFGSYGTGSNSNSHDVNGHYRSNGTYVAPSHATNPNSTQTDNYSTRGNYNPYSGSYGTRTPKY